MTGTPNRALDSLRKRPMLLVPALIAGLFFAAIAYALETAGISSWEFFGNLNARGTPAFNAYAASIVAVGLRILGFSFGLAMTTAAAVRAPSALTRISGAFGLLVLLGAAAAALVVPTFGISALAYGVFLMYAPAGAALNRLSAPDAIVDSIRTAAQNPGASIAAIVTVAVLGFAGQLVGWLPVPAMSQFSTALSWVAMEAGAAFAALVAVAACSPSAAEADQGR